jgi:hypothetical protein
VKGAGFEPALTRLACEFQNEFEFVTPQVIIGQQGAEYNREKGKEKRKKHNAEVQRRRDAEKITSQRYVGDDTFKNRRRCLS